MAYPMLSTRQADSGWRGHDYTLMEIIIVLAIISLIAGFVAPRVGVIPDRIKRADTIKTLNSAFHMAAGMAIATGQKVTLDIVLAEHAIRLKPSGKFSSRSSRNDAEKNQNNASLYSDIQSFVLADDVILDPYASSGNNDEAPKYDFYPNGEAAGPQTELLIADSYRLIINVDRITGRPYFRELKH